MSITSLFQIPSLSGPYAFLDVVQFSAMSATPWIFSLDSFRCTPLSYVGIEGGSVISLDVCKQQHSVVPPPERTFCIVSPFQFTPDEYLLG